MLIRRAALAVLCAALTACTAPAAVTDATTTSDGAQTWPRGKRPTMPDLTGPTTDGRRLHLADYKGHVIVLNAWATYCGPCRSEAPTLAHAQKTLAARGLQVVGLNGGDNTADAAAFIKDHRLGYPTLMDAKGRQALRMPRGTVSQSGLPYSVFIDRTGHIAATVIGAASEPDLKKITTPLLRERA
ncbi:TlpA disulfide reductase family protein [Streptomyces sp. NPDC051133]|uniref:TlpA family protein disulfide reductase n=1 Tax=Streptomyces sp. NPDC051133 TaxID=3155521 RepID=UPI0034254E72